MMKKSKITDGIVLGFAAFSMFFGAGNLIFPAGIGAAAGTQWPVALLALTIASIIVPLLALMATTQKEGGYEAACEPIGKWYYNFTFAFLSIFVVTLANLPRTAATTYEMSVAPFFPQIPIWAVVIVYFAIALFLALDTNQLVDRIGKYMTPVLLVLMVIIIVKGFITPISATQPTGQEGVFANAFIELYYTGDIYSGLMFSMLLAAAAMNKGYTNDKERRGVMGIACVIAGIAFFVIYGGLLVIGANANSVYGADMDRTTLLVSITQHLLGGVGAVALALAVAIACMSTAVALISMGGNFFSGLTKNKVSYKTCVIVICVLGCVIGSMGVENIISFAGPAFLTVFPAGIVLTVVALMGKWCPNQGAYKYSVLFALACGAVDGLAALGIPGVSMLTAWLPFAGVGFAWVVPAIVGFFVGWAKYKFVPAK